MSAGAPRVLVAGVGNVFRSDDGFGVMVAERLAGRPMPPGVRVADIGVRGVHLAFELLDGYDVLVLIDALPMGEAPGTVAVIEGLPEEGAVVPDAHGMDPRAVLALAARMGGRVGRVLVVGCEPATVAEGMGLSPPVAQAVDVAVAVVGELVATPVALEVKEVLGCSDG